MKAQKIMDELDETTESILKEYNYEKDSLISILLSIQEKFNYLPKEAMVKVANDLKIRLIDVYSVATFYKVFSLKPRGKYVINVCVGTACHVRGGRRIVDKIQKELDIEVGETTADMMFTLETVRCLGACSLGPVMVVNGEYHGQLSTQKTDTILNQYKAKAQEGNT
jgi:NADH-quinone oxidoreductase subunit E